MVLPHEIDDRTCEPQVSINACSAVVLGGYSVRRLYFRFEVGERIQSQEPLEGTIGQADDVG